MMLQDMRMESLRAPEGKIDRFRRAIVLHTVGVGTIMIVYAGTSSALPNNDRRDASNEQTTQNFNSRN